jgi:hypothetical protein
LSIIQGPFPVIKCQTLISRFATFSSLQVTETRAHAQGTLLSLGMDEAAEPFLETAKVPDYITHLSSPSRRGPLGKDYRMSKFMRSKPDPSMRPMTAPAEMVQ